MTIGERIKAKRKEKNISVEYVAKALGVSVSTVYRYEDSTIEKIPIKVFDKLCQIFETSASELMGNDSTVQKTADSELPREFENAQDAMEFMLKMPTLAAFGGYNPDEMSEETIVEFANIRRLYLLTAYTARCHKKFCVHTNWDTPCCIQNLLTILMLRQKMSIRMWNMKPICLPWHCFVMKMNLICRLPR